MKVMQVVPRMDIGGVERGIVDIAQYFKDKDIKQIVVSGGGRLIRELEKVGCLHWQLPVYRKSLLSIFLIPKLKKLIQKEHIDIIHARSRLPAWLSFFASRLTATPFITTAHGVYKNRFFSEVMGWGKFVVCPSRTVSRHMYQVLGVPEEKIVVINRWVNLEKFTFISYEVRKKSNTIVAVGRISPSKGYEYLIEGFRKVLRTNPYLKLKIVGSAEKSKQKYFTYLRTLVNRFALNYNVQFLGFKEDIGATLREARIFVAPSVIDEAFGRVVVEALACGIPVIASSVGGFKEIIEDGRDGLLIEPKNNEAIASAIIRILGDHKLAETLAVNGRKKVERLYTMDKCLKETEAVYLRTKSLLRILVIKLSSLGDVILVIPSLKELKEHLPEAKICLLTLKRHASLLYDCPYVDEVITVSDDYKKFRKLLDIAQGLRRRSFDYIIDFQNSRASHIISFLSFPLRSFGYSLRLGFLLTKRIPYHRRDCSLRSQERLLELLGIRFKEKRLVFWKPKPYAEDFLPEADYIGINVSASARWQSKNWPDSHIVNLIGMIYKNYPSYRVVLLGDGSAHEKAKMLEKYLKPLSVDLCGKISLQELPAVIAKLKLLITPDTATLHLALSLGIPVVALFGPTDPLRHVVMSDNLYLLYRRLPCSFCYKPKCKLKEKNLCMESISAQEVFARVKDIIQKTVVSRQ